MTACSLMEKLARLRWYYLAVLLPFISASFAVACYYANALTGIPPLLMFVPVLYFFYKATAGKAGTSDCYDCGILAAYGWLCLVLGAIDWLMFFAGIE